MASNFTFDNTFSVTIHARAQDVETYPIKAATSREESEKIMALGYEFHYKAPDSVDLFRKRLVGLD